MKATERIYKVHAYKTYKNVQSACNENKMRSKSDSLTLARPEEKSFDSLTCGSPRALSVAALSLEF